MQENSLKKYEGIPMLKVGTVVYIILSPLNILYEKPKKYYIVDIIEKTGFGFYYMLSETNNKNSCGRAIENYNIGYNAFLKEELAQKAIERIKENSMEFLKNICN